MTRNNRFVESTRPGSRPCRTIMMAATGVAIAGLVSCLPTGALAAPAWIWHIPAVRPPPIATEAQALRALARHGLTDVLELGPVGDYWEANAYDHGKPVVVYLFDDGTLRIERHPTIMVQAGTRVTPAQRAS